MKKTYKALPQQLLLLSLCSGALMAGPCQAGPSIPGFVGNAADVLPQIPATMLPTGGVALQGIDSIREMTASQMEIIQAAPKAVIHWQTFNIGSQSSVHFDQQGNAGWQALNVIADANPSQIQGRLSADGGVYLINQNGILFGPTAQVNVHDLTASSLNLKEEEFIGGYSSVNGNNQQVTSFRNDAGAAGGKVENRGQIRVATGGSALLIGGEVENSGSIEAPQGQVALAAGNEVSLIDTENTGRKLIPEIATSGDGAVATNRAVYDANGQMTGGIIETSEGVAGLYGGIVNQAGRIVAMTAVQRNGQVELVATNRVTTSADSVTATPVSESPEREGVAEFHPGEITVKAREVDLGGSMTSAGGNVTITATERIVLGPESLIDVSGLLVNESAADRLLDVQLTSEVLKDSQFQKQGPLLGQKVTVDILTGMPSADLSGYLNNRNLSAAERLTAGGTIAMNATAATGAIEVGAGAQLSFAGGGIHYAGGPLQVTTVRAGNRIYTLADLPADLPVDEVLGLTQQNHERFGVTAQWYGVYCGGASPLIESDPGLFLGSDAGRLEVQTPFLSLQGDLDGHVLQGLTQTEGQEWTDAQGRLNALGHKRPLAGNFTLGVEGGSGFGSGAISEDAITEAIFIRGGAGGPALGHPAGTRLTVIDADTLNAARLSQVNLYANTTLAIDSSAAIELMPGGSFRGMARQVYDAGTITTPGGAVALAALSNVTSFQTLNGVVNDRYIPLEERIEIDAGSVIEVSGEVIDNFGLADSEVRYGITKGGSIDLENRSSFTPESAPSYNPGQSGTITFSNGARLSARGGYWRGATGTVRGGDAGSITLATADGTDPFLTIDGTLEGQALLGNQGGALTIKAASILVVPATGPAPQPPAGPEGSLTYPADLLVIADNRFARMGFSSLSLQAANDLTVARGSWLAPSSLRLAPPESGTLTNGGDALIEASPFEAGLTEISLSAGQSTLHSGGRLTVERGSTVTVMPAGLIELHGNPATATTVTIAGTIEAPAGRITVAGKDLLIEESGRLLATGTVLPLLAPAGNGERINQQVLGGGAIALSALEGDLDIAAGALLDVSGSPRVTNLIPDEVSGFHAREEAGGPGSLSFTYRDAFILDGTVVADVTLPGLAGGATSITQVSTALFVPEAEMLTKLQAAGFDDLTLASPAGIAFADGTHLEAPRALTLDTPLLKGGNGRVTVSAPWVRLINTQDKTLSSPTAGGSGGELLVEAGFLDIEGNVQLSGFQATSLRATHDLRLADQFYVSNDTPGWSGELATGGDLLLQAAAVYPLTGSRFTIHAGGALTLLPQDQGNRHPIYSAGGELIVEAATIDHQGVLAAPMGDLTLQATGRIQLAPGSLLSVRGEGDVALGTLQFGLWEAYDKGGDSQNATKTVQQPAGTLTLAAGEIVAQPGSVMDAGAGGSVSGHEFQPGLTGTVNPLTQNGRLIIVADNSVLLPGRSVYLEGNEALGLEAGFYSVLPESFGFLAEALVLEACNGEALPGRNTVNRLGQPVLAGYETVLGTSIRPAAMQGYTVRRASDVLREGRFDVKGLAVNDGGAITLAGQSMVLAGEISAAGTVSGRGGSLSAAGTAIHYGALPATFPVSAWEGLAAEVQDGLFIDNDALRTAGLGSLTLGDNGTESITLSRDTVIEGIPQVSLLANDTILLEEGAVIRALGTDDSEGVLELHAQTLTSEAGSLLYASDELLFDLSRDMALNGEWGTDHGRLRFISDLIFLGGQEDERPAAGLFLGDDTLLKFAGITDLGIQSRSDIRFLGSFDLDLAGSLTLDAGRLLVESGVAPGQAVHLGADGLTLQNSGPAPQLSSLPAGDHTLALDAGRLTLGPGALRLDSFRTITLASAGELLFTGAAALDAGLAAGGTLDLEASRFRALFPSATDLPFTPSSLAINGHEGQVVFRGRPGAAPEDAAAVVPGKIEVRAGAITLTDARLELPGGVIDLCATAGGGDLSLLGTSVLDTAGGLFPFLPAPAPGEAAPAFVLHGGNVFLEAEQGDIEVGAAAIVDVSDQEGGEAGALTLTAAQGEVGLGGTFLGAGDGSLFMDTLALSDFSALNRKRMENGFAGSFGLRLRTGDLLVAEDEVVAAREIDLAADQGAVSIEGVLRADGEEEGGRVTIHAGGNLLLESGGAIEARGTGLAAAGGEVFLSSVAGAIETRASSRIDVSGEGEGGTVTVRALWNGNALPLSPAGEIRGSRRTVVQAVQRVEDSSIAATDLTAWKSATDALMAAVAAPQGMVIVPEIEVWSPGAMTLLSGLNTLAAWRSGGAPGVLTFRSGGDLKVETDVIDAPTPLDSTISYNRLIDPDGEADSFGLNFIAGADLTAADFMATGETGNLFFGKKGAVVTVYTESAPIRFASGAATTVYSPGTTSRDYMPGVQLYTLATYDGSIEGRTGGDLNLNDGGVVQTATGDIRLSTGGDVRLGQTGAIRTTGRAPEWSETPGWLQEYASLAPQPTRLKGGNLLRFMRFWDYRDGGSITVAARGSIDGKINTGSGRGWDAVSQETIFTSLPDLTQSSRTSHWNANYSGKDATTGIAAMAGGDIRLMAEGDVRGQAGVFGTGKLTVAAGGALDGRFLAAAGDLELSTRGSFGGRDADVPIETGGGHLSLQALGSIALGVIDNPGIFNNFIDSSGLAYNLGYAIDSAATVVAVNGSVSFSGATPLYDGILGQEPRSRVLPPSLAIYAGQDIVLRRDDWLMAPSSQGGLTLIAGRDISGAFPSSTPGKWTQGALIMSDADPGDYLGVQEAAGASAGGNLVDNMRFEHQGTVLHRDDERPVLIHAGRDLTDLSLILPKAATIRADNDIRNLQYIGQNLAADDLSFISAGHDLTLTQPADFEGGYRSLQQGGPGYFLVEAGNSMDLGLTTSTDIYDITSFGGIVTYGAAFNPALQSGSSDLGRAKGSDIAVIVGYDFQPGQDELDLFVASLRQKARQFSELQNSGDLAGAALIKEEVRSELLGTFLAGHRSGEGALNMTSSTINTKSGEDSIAIITAGEVNVGVSTINKAPVQEGITPDTGIFSTSGGDITMVAGGNINVNESRVMSFLGGDILLLSDHGDINAGRGSRTTVIVAPPRVETTWNNNNTPADPTDDFEEKKMVFDPPATGSGLRALAYDPDASGPLLPPEPGDMYVVAWEGVVDAGEAGIEGGRLFLAATQVLNAQNISFAGVSVGVPAAAGPPAGLGALSGSSMEATATTASQIAKETTASTSGADTMAETAKKISEALTQLRFFVVKFLGFIEAEAVAAERPPAEQKDEAQQAPSGH